MNIDAKNFILNINKFGYKDYRLAFSCKITNTNISTDRVCIIYQNKPLNFILYILNILTKNKNIENWVNKVFSYGKTVIFSFTNNIRKIYIEKVKGQHNDDIFFNRSIEWEMGNEDNFINRNYTLCKQNPDDFIHLIPSELNEYITYNTCLSRSDDQLYIRHNQDILLNDKLYEIFKMMILKIYNDTDISKFTEWYNLHRGRNVTFNWIQITPENMTIYVC